MIKKTIPLLLAVVSILSLFGCHRQDQMETSPTTRPITLTQVTTPTATQPTVPAQATTQTQPPTTQPTIPSTEAPTKPTETAPTVDPATVWTPLCESYINMRKTPGGSLLTTVPVGAKLILQKWYEKHALVTYGDLQGYVSAGYIQPTEKDYFAKRLQVVTPTSRYTYQQMLTDLDKLQALYPNLVQIGSIGKSELGRDIPVVRVGDPNAKYHVIIQGSMHAREHFTTWLIMAITDYTLSQNQASLGNVCYHMIPMVNPDGVIISQRESLDTTQTAIYQRDLAQGYTSAGEAYYAQQWKANALGVDLNRNFPSGWDASLEHSQPSSERYRGESPLSAAESKALADYTRSRHFDATISMHSFGSVLYYQYGSKQPVNTLSYSFALAVEKATGYIPVESDGTTGAGYKDWAMDELGIPSLTVEVGSSQPPLDSRELYNTFARFEGFLPAISAWLTKQ